MKADKNLEAIEAKIREQAEEVRRTRRMLYEETTKLGKVVKDYEKRREELQREIWRKRGLGWCQRCEKFYPKEKIELLYMTKREGDIFPKIIREIKSVCSDCAEILLSSPRGGEKGFQCYKARVQLECGFAIFFEGAWRPISHVANIEEVTVKIERKYISESEYNIGKWITFDRWSPKLKIAQEEVL